MAARGGPCRFRRAVATRSSPVLLGRAAELELLERMLGDVRGGKSAVLVILGEAGVGKTALLPLCNVLAETFPDAEIEHLALAEALFLENYAAAAR